MSVRQGTQQGQAGHYNGRAHTVFGTPQSVFGVPQYVYGTPQFPPSHDSSMTIESDKIVKEKKSIGDLAAKRNDELNILLVIIGLLAATITSFIIYTQPLLQQDPGDETAALLRVLIYNTNQTALGSGPAPQVPDWNGPPQTLFATQVILYGCLCSTLACGLYAMLIKFLTDSNALNWKRFRIVNWLTRWVFFVVYLLLIGVFGGLFFALILQMPFLSGTGTIYIKALNKLKG